MFKLDAHDIDAHTNDHPSYVGGLSGSSSRLPFHSHTTLQPVPLSRGASIQHSIQPIDEVVRIEILGLLRYVQVLCSNDWALADRVIALGFGAPFGIAGRQPVSIYLTRHLPFVGQYGKRIRTNKGVGVLSVEAFVDSVKGDINHVGKTCIYKYQDRCQRIFIMHLNILEQTSPDMCHIGLNSFRIRRSCYGR